MSSRPVRTAILATLLLLVTALAGCLGVAPSGQDGGDGTDPADDVIEPRPTAVIGLQDNGINPYHETFRWNDSRAWVHPSEYIPDYPEDAVGLDLSLDAPNMTVALRQDCTRIWSQIEPGQLYWFPGTKIVGAITFQDVPEPDCDADRPSPDGIYASSHGTATSSRAASTEYGACEECKIVMVEGFNERGVEWLGENHAWIDVQSHSWLSVVPVWSGPVETGLITAHSSLVQTVEESAQENLAFWASGNGIANRFGVVGHPTLLTQMHTPSVVVVGGHDNGHWNTWPGFWPHVVADSCGSWSASHSSMNESSPSFGGTSSATPFAAGGAARILLEARQVLGHVDTGVHDGVVARGNASGIDSGPLADGELTLAEWKDLVKSTASSRPAGEEADGDHCGLGYGLLYGSTPVAWEDVPEAYPQVLQIGYGAVDEEAKQRAFAVLRGEEPVPERAQEDAFFSADQAAREQLHRVWSAELAQAASTAG